MRNCWVKQISERGADKSLDNAMRDACPSQGLKGELGPHRGVLGTSGKADAPEVTIYTMPSKGIITTTIIIPSIPIIRP